MLKTFKEQKNYIPITNVTYRPVMEICQTDYPLDWYQQEFIPYAEEYQALPDRKLETIIPWMRKYVEPAQQYFGNQLLLLAHFYMGGEIVNVIKYFGGEVEDSYKLALTAARHPEKKIIVESAVHFMAESS
jgi:quinolinate synthase